MNEVEKQEPIMDYFASEHSVLLCTQGNSWISYQRMKRKKKCVVAADTAVAVYAVVGVAVGKKNERASEREKEKETNRWFYATTCYIFFSR